MSYGIELWRFVFTSIVCLLHFEGAYVGWDSCYIFKCGYLGVEFFFILSGFLMMRHNRHNDDSSGEYIIGRIKRFYPSLIISWSIIIIYRIVNSKWDFLTSINDILEHIWEYLLLSGIGMSWDTLNPPEWYISVLLITSYFLYWLIKKMKNVL